MKAKEQWFRYLADFMDVQINQLEKIRADIKRDHIPVEHENDPDYAWCDECMEYYHVSEHLWKGDLALCPKCESNLEI